MQQRKCGYTMTRINLLLFSLICSTASAFGPVSNIQGRVAAVTKKATTRLFDTRLSTVTLVGKYFQVEEMEDRDSCTTEVILNADSTVTVLETNGPRFLSASGTWKLEPSGNFDMTLNRTYEAGKKSKKFTDVGVFEFTTFRQFLGQLSNIGEKQGIEGSVYDSVASQASERKVGFFEMIDTTVGEDGEMSLRGGIRVSN